MKCTTFLIPVQFPVESHCHTRNYELLISLRDKTANKKTILKAKITAQN